jgi:hypothetical protein
MKPEVAVAYLVNKRRIPGRKAIQKLVYFCKEMGIPLTCSYRMYLYGPYSNEVAQVAQELLADRVISEDGGGFVAGPNCATYLDGNKKEFWPYVDKLDLVLERFQSFTPRELELLATTHFIASSLKAAYGKVGEPVIADIYKAKGGKFQPEEIWDAYHRLQKWNML